MEFPKTVPKHVQLKRLESFIAEMLFTLLRCSVFNFLLMFLR